MEKRLFTESNYLIESLHSNAVNYPLIKKMYVSIVEKYYQKDGQKNYFDHNDWLMIPYFSLLIDSNITQGTSIRLQNIERKLGCIRRALGDVEFNKLAEELSDKCRTLPTVNAIYNKLLDYYAEFRATIYYNGPGRFIERIPERNNNGKSADLRVVNEYREIKKIVECKFIHQTNPIDVFIRRYMNYLCRNSNYFIISGLHAFTYDECFNDPSLLTPEHISALKHFMNQIDDNKLIEHDLVFSHKNPLRIKYRCKENLGSALTAIENQLEILRQVLESVYKGKVSRKVADAKLQKKASCQQNEQECVYILMHLNEECSPPWEGIDAIKEGIKQRFLANCSIDIELIIETFPD